MEKVTMRWTILSAMMLLVSIFSTQSVLGQEEGYYIIAEGPNWVLYDSEDPALAKTQSRFDFNFTVSFPGSSWEVGEQGTLSWSALNGAVGHMKWDASSNPATAFSGSFSGISSKEIDVIPSNSGEYRFQLRGEESTSFDGTECCRTKLLVVQVGAANNNVAPTALDVTVEGLSGTTLCADAEWNDPDTPENRLQFDVVTAPDVGVVSDDDGDKRFCYRSPTNFVGSKNLTFQIYDLDGEKFSNPGTITFVFTGQVRVMEIKRFSANPTSINVGEAVTLSVDVEYAERCFGEGGPSQWDTAEFAVDPDGRYTNTFSSGVFNSAGTYTLELMCRAGTAQQTKTVVITVQEPQDPLSCSGFASFNMNEGDTQRTEASCNAAGLKVNNLLVNNNTKPSWITMIVDQDEIEFVFNPPSGSAGTYRLQGSITSTERSGTEPFDFTVTVRPLAQAPVCEASNLSFSVPAGQSFTRTFEVTDGDNTNAELTVSKTGLSFVTASNVTSNRVTLSGSPGHGLVGTQSGTITVSDPGGLSCVVNVSITVTPTTQNQAPECVVNWNPNAVAGEPWSFTVVPSDPEGDKVKVTFTNRPSGNMVMVPSTFQDSGTTFTGSWPQPFAGVYDVGIRCLDDKNNSVLVINSLTVLKGDPECQDPVWEYENQRNVPLTILPGREYDYTLDVNAPTGNVTLSFDSEHEAKWLRLDGMRLHGTAPVAPGRDDKVRIRATNSNGGCQALLVWNISVLMNVGTEDDEELPQVVTLHQNYPNPFNPSTTIPYSLPEASHVQIGIYDVMGRELKILLDENQPAGNHEVQVDISGSGWSSQTYIIRMSVGDKVMSRPITLLK